MLPTRVGLEQTVSPYSWGFDLTIVHQIGYVLVTLRQWQPPPGAWHARAAMIIGFFAILYYFGLTKLPWPAVDLHDDISCLAGRWQGTCRRHFPESDFSPASPEFWPQAMLSVYLCGIAVVISFVAGSTHRHPGRRKTTGFQQF